MLKQQRTEAEVGRMCDQLAELMGWKVERYEQTRNTRIHKGLPDRRYVKPGVSAVWVELKKPKGKLTVEQYGWLKSELDSDGLAVVIDDEVTLAAILKDAASQSSMVRSALRKHCREVIELTAQRGFRPS